MRNIQALQAGSEIDTLVFDKTGTLTTGQMEVTEVITFNNFDRNDLITLAKSLEQHASHPIAKAIVKFAENYPSLDVNEIQVEKGLGIRGKVGEDRVKIGNASFVNFRKNNRLYCHTYLYCS